MKTTLYYYTGTGNSLWAARYLAGLLDAQTDIIPMKKTAEEKRSDNSDSLGLIFPVHIWGLPRAVIDFVKRLDAIPRRYYFAVAVNAGQVSRTLIQLKELMACQGLTLQAGFSLVMPSNYIPWGGPGPQEKQNQRFDAAKSKLLTIKTEIAGSRKIKMEKGPLWQNILFTWIYKMSFPHVPEMDKKFWSDEKCTSCGVCCKICPTGNVELADGKPVWKHRCEQCLACLQWCPPQAIQYGKKTPKYPRYHHPEIKIKDLTDLAT